MVKEFENSGFWALILGGSSGLGLASALKLASAGMNICIVHRNSRSELTEIEAQFNKIRALVDLESFNLDVLKPDNLDLVIEALKVKLADKGKIRCLLHSIAKGNLKPLVVEGRTNLENGDFILTMQHMAISLHDWTKALFRARLFAEDARIISFTSEGSQKAIPNYAAVSAAKAALEAITRSIAMEYAPFGIRANCIQAGVTDTASLRKIPGNEELKDHSLQRNPFKRLTTPADVANVVFLLCKKEAAWINGVVLPVDGGEHIR